MIPIEPDDDVEHGVNAYKAGCRCDVCRDEWAALQTMYRRRAGIPARPADWGHPKHGTRAQYVDGCRCEDCRRANRQYQRIRYQQKKVGDYVEPQ